MISSKDKNDKDVNEMR